MSEHANVVPVEPNLAASLLTIWNRCRKSNEAGLQSARVLVMPKTRRRTLVKVMPFKSKRKK